MTVDAHSGPIVVFGRARPGGGIGFAQDYNPDSPAPSLFEYSTGLLDTRTPFVYQPGMGAGQTFCGYLGGSMTLVDQAPSAISAVNVAATQAMTAATPLTLVSVTGGGITVGASVVNALTGATVTGLLAIDTAMTPAFPSAAGAGMGLWNPAKAISRAISFTTTDNLSGLTFTVAGYDLYGYPLTATVTGPNNTTVNTLKAFKYIASITPSGTNAGAVTVGTADIFGIPLRTDVWGYLTVYWANVLITAATGYVAAVTTDPSTALIGDVRGTYAVQGTASDGTRALQVFWRPKVANLSQTGIWGIAQI